MSAQLVAVALLVASAGLLCALCIPANISRWLGYGALALASLAALGGALHELSAGSSTSVWVALALAHAVVRIDATSAAFVAIVSVVALAASVYALGGKARDERHQGRAGAAAANLIWIGSIIVCSSGDVWFLLFGWELVALGFYAAIAYSGNDEFAGVAAYYTLVITHVAGAGIVAGLLVLANAAHSLGVVEVAAAGSALEPAARTAIFFLLLAGFGAKIGLLPLQGWLPYGYPAAPTAIAALMAGGALNVGFYGIIRFLIGFGGTMPLTWGLVVVILGALGAFFGIAWAQAQRDVRLLAAFSSVENAGLIVVVLGIALVGRSVGLPLLVGLGLAAAYVQIAAHALAKSLLFLCASGIRNAVGTLSFESLGGLVHRLPLHATAGLVAAMSLAALPPLGGFTGEWLVLESCMQGFRTANAPAEVTLALAGAVVGLSAGVAIVAFVKFVGIALLGAPRNAAAATAIEPRSPFQTIALAGLSLSILGLGIATPWYLRALTAAIDGIAHADVVARMTASLPLIQPTFPGFSSASGLGLGVTIVIAACAFGIIVRLIPRPATKTEQPWTSGAAYAPWTQYTGTGFANPTRVILHAAVRTVRTTSGDVFDPHSVASEYDSVSRQFFDLPNAIAIGNAFLSIAAIVRRTQSGIIAAYLSYILAFALAVLVLYPSIRHW
ncbi:MAG: proton-conducting transporter membrane subunit [Candidatus Velthaea sp.]